jgi:hypothetical protein
MQDHDKNQEGGLEAHWMMYSQPPPVRARRPEIGKVPARKLILAMSIILPRSSRRDDLVPNGLAPAELPWRCRLK